MIKKENKYNNYIFKRFKSIILIEIIERNIEKENLIQITTEN